MLNRIKNLLVGRKARPFRKRAYACPLDSVNSGLMRLEERIVPAYGNSAAAYTWSPVGGSSSWTDQNNWLNGNWITQYGRGKGYPGGGTNGYQDQALLGAYRGDCHVDGTITIAILRLTGFADTLYVDNPLYVQGYPTNGVWGRGISSSTAVVLSI